MHTCIVRTSLRATTGSSCRNWRQRILCSSRLRAWLITCLQGQINRLLLLTLMLGYVIHTDTTPKCPDYIKIYFPPSMGNLNKIKSKSSPLNYNTCTVPTSKSPRSTENNSTVENSCHRSTCTVWTYFAINCSLLLVKSFPKLYSKIIKFCKDGCHATICMTPVFTLSLLDSTTISHFSDKKGL